jgi:hypothetical protein
MWRKARDFIPASACCEELPVRYGPRTRALQAILDLIVRGITDPARFDHRVPTEVDAVVGLIAE